MRENCFDTPPTVRVSVVEGSALARCIGVALCASREMTEGSEYCKGGCEGNIHYTASQGLHLAILVGAAASELVQAQESRAHKRLYLMACPSSVTLPRSPKV